MFHECHRSERNTDLKRYHPENVFASEAFISTKQGECFELDRHTFPTTTLHVKACHLGEISELYDPFEHASTRKADAKSRRTGSWFTTESWAMLSSSSSGSDCAPSYTSSRHPPSEDDFLASSHPQLQSASTSDRVNVGLTPFLDEAQRDAAYTALRAVGLPPYGSNIQFLPGRRRAEVNFFPSASSSNWKARSSLVPVGAKAGDSISFIFGTGATFALRRVAGHDSGEAFRVIGQCYSRDIDECTLEFCQERDGEVAYFHRRGRPEGEDPLRLPKQRISLV